MVLELSGVLEVDRDESHGTSPTFSRLWEKTIAAPVG